MKRTSNSERNQDITGDEEFRLMNPYRVKRIREQLARVHMPKVRPAAVASFMLLPQFRSCFEGLSHLYPILVRMVAVLFAECGLIPVTHSALKYRNPQEKTNASMKSLIGDAWYSLRTTRATTFQYGMFSAVVMMIVCFFGALGAFFGRVMLGVGSVAQAQIFNVFQNPNNPYPSTACTDPGEWTSIKCGTATITASPNAMFDQRVFTGTGTPNGISADYALMVLDKVLRQSMADTPNGGAIQTALRGLMMTYNTGMLVVACVMLGWLVVSLIIDTAKTGTVGGGRHNMVWLPVRVIFALGIMFPIGSVGFSGGQFMVVKLAEWGSNFGTNGWTTYVSSVVGNRQLLAPFSVRNSTDIVNGITKTMVCQVAYNTYLQQRTGGLPADQIIDAKTDPAAGGIIYEKTRYTNLANTNLCGTISYGATVADDYDAQLDWDPNTGTAPMSASNQRNAQPDNVYKNTALSTAAKAYRTAMRAAVRTQLMPGGPAMVTAHNFACQFVARHWNNGDASVTTGNPVADIPECPSAAAAAADPSIAPLAGIQTDLQTAQMTAFNGAGRTALENYIGIGTGIGTSPMLTEMSIRGWAGMGMWYQDIVTLNNIMLSARAPTATVEAGGAWIGSTSPGWEDRCAASGSNPQGENCKYPLLAEKVMSIMQDYDRWWSVSSMSTDPGKGGALPTEQGNAEMSRVATGTSSSVMGTATSMSYGSNDIFSVFLRAVLPPRASSAFIFNAVDLQATNTYPLTQLAETGHSILGIGMTLWTVISIIQSVSTIKGVISAGQGLAFSALMQVLAMLGSVMIFTGILISFYLPAMPFIRVAFAVLTWITSVFEAVVMVPVAALTHLSSTGPGLMGQHGRIAWVLWFNVFMRPILVVFGFIGGMLIYNAFAVYFHTTFSQGAALIMNQGWGIEPSAYIARICYSVVYLATLYAVANSTFKFMEILPNQLMRWMGEWGAGASATPPVNHDPGGRALGFAGAQVMQEIKGRTVDYIGANWKANAIDWTHEQRNALLLRAEALGPVADGMEAAALQQRLADQKLTIERMNARERAEYASLDKENRERYLQHKFLEQSNRRFHRTIFERGIGYSSSDRFVGYRAKTPNIIPGMPNFTGRTAAGMLNPMNWSFKGTLTPLAINAVFAARLQGEGRFMHRDNHQDFRALGMGQAAGAAFSDDDLDKTLSMGNTTHTSNWDMMSDVQRQNARNRILASLSSADNLYFIKLSGEGQEDFLESYYNTDEEAFAPGVGQQGVDKMIDYLKYPEKLKDPAAADEANKLMRFMTRQEKAAATGTFLKWAKQNGASDDPSILMGQLATQSFSDRALDSALGFGARAVDNLKNPGIGATIVGEVLTSNRLVRGILDTVNASSISQAKALTREMEEQIAKLELEKHQLRAYERATQAQKDTIAKLKYEEFEAREKFEAGKISMTQFAEIRDRNNTVMNMVIADVDSRGKALDSAEKALAVMTAKEKVAYEALSAAEQAEMEKWMERRRKLSEDLIRGAIKEADYFAQFRKMSRQIRKEFGVKI